MLLCRLCRKLNKKITLDSISHHACGKGLEGNFYTLLKGYLQTSLLFSESLSNRNVLAQFWKVVSVSEKMKIGKKCPEFQCRVTGSARDFLFQVSFTSGVCGLKSFVLDFLNSLLKLRLCLKTHQHIKFGPFFLFCTKLWITLEWKRYQKPLTRYWRKRR